MNDSNNYKQPDFFTFSDNSILQSRNISLGGDYNSPSTIDPGIDVDIHVKSFVEFSNGCEIQTESVSYGDPDLNCQGGNISIYE